MMTEEVKHPFSERVLRDMSSSVLVLDRRGCIVYVNAPASRLLEVKEGPVEEVHMLTVGDNTYNDRFIETILNALYDKEETTHEKVPFMAPSGKKHVFFMSCSYLRESEQDEPLLVVTLQDETEKEEMKQKLDDSSKTFCTFIAGFCLWILLYALWEFLGRPIPADFLTHGVELLGILMLIFILACTSLSWRDLGITTKTPWKTIGTGLLVAAGGFVLLVVLKLVARIFVPTAFEPEAPFFDISRFGLRQVLYIFTAGIQEFLARSVMQGNLRRIITAKHPGLLAIMLSSLIFAALHIHLGFIFMIGAAILAGLEGILYEKQQNIFGVWIVHWVFGVSGTLLCLIDH
ncbi:MAG: CPBP family intramembrane metalloprotease [Lachnospiraceae bacterium]|nr:CPBP family intramembrane metalloprotease [Lachnospiraceae bacterium]